MTDHLKELSALGVSIWLDDLNRPLITSGGLQDLIDKSSVVGVTTNPSIFAAALSQGDTYNEQIKELAAEGKTVDEAVFALTTEDVRNACDIMLPVSEATGGQDGRVSIEVEPALAHDTAGTVEQVRQLRDAVDRPNVHVKIPATVEGLPAISQALAQGISINVTLIFSLDRYRGVMNAFLTGLEQARQGGLDLSQIHSVASFFVSRVDTEVDKRLDASAPTRPRRSEARPARPTPGWPTTPTKRSSRPRVGRTSRPTARTSSAPCGRPRESRTRHTRTRSMSRSWSHPTPSTRCPPRRCWPLPTMARSPATR